MTRPTGIHSGQMMAESDTPALRGFDSYEVTLGDELRGHRATRGKSLLDVQRDLRIRASYVDAIENCDPSVIPNKGFVAGYVRAYARYLELDAEDIYTRFCAQSGFVGQNAGGARLGRGKTGSLRDPALSRSHFAAPVGRARQVGIGVSLSGVASVAVVAGLVAGLGYGGWNLMLDIQRVEFAPANDAPEVADAPSSITLATLSMSALAETPRARDAALDAALVALYAPLEPAPPTIELRDGPMNAIDPRRAGVFASTEPDQAPLPARGASTAAASAPADFAAAARLVAAAQTAAGGSAAPSAAALAAESAAAPAPASTRTGVWIVVADPAWLRVRLAGGGTLVQRIFKRGDRFEMPEGVRGAMMRAGNAGGVYLEVDGVLHGPVGNLGGVAKAVSLDAQEVRARFAPALTDPLASQADAPRTEAKLELE
jgi:cytoskeletal protein RodZ